MSERKAMAKRIKDWMEDDRMFVQYRGDGNGNRRRVVRAKESVER